MNPEDWSRVIFNVVEKITKFLMHYDLLFLTKIRLIFPRMFQNTNIKRIDLPYNIKQICKEAFYKCSNLNYVTIPKSVKEIEDNIFIGCEKLETLYIPKKFEKRIKDIVGMNIDNIKIIYY